MKNEAVFAHLDKCTGDPGSVSNPAPAKHTSLGYFGSGSPRVEVHSLIMLFQIPTISIAPNAEIHFQNT